MADRDRGGYYSLTKLGLGALAFNSALAIYDSWGDAGSVAFVLAADAALWLLFLCLREFERRGGRGRDDTKVRAAVWALTTFLTVFAIYNSWGEASSVGFALLADAALVLLFLCFREFEQCGGRGKDAKTKAAVWCLTTLLTAMFASGLAPTIMPLGVGALVFICLRDVDHVLAGEEEEEEEGGGGINMAGQYCALAKVGLAMLTCKAALDADDTRRDNPASAVLVFVSYVVLVILTGLFIRAFSRGHAGEQEQH